MRLDRFFTHRLIMTPVASYIGYAAMALGAWALVSGVVSAWYLLPLLVGTFFMLMGVTVGLHRLFCHRSFRTSKFWHVVLAYLGTLAIYGSTVQWCAMHVTHHRYSDTPRDPHYTGWRYLFWKRNNPTELNRRLLMRLYRDPLHRFFFKWYVLVVGITAVGLTVVDPWLTVFLYLTPLGWLHLVGSIHQVFAHDETGPLDQKWKELWLCTGGEWLHQHHHRFTHDPCFGPFDLGWLFIKAIRS